MRLLRIALPVSCLLGLFLGVAAGQIPATDDSYTTSSSPASNYGTQSSVNVIGPGSTDTSVSTWQLCLLD